MVRFALVACATRSSLAERPIEQAPSDVLRIPASGFDDPKLKSQVVDLRSGIGPDEAATIAVYANPALRAIRNRRGLAAAQLIQAGILPNPVVSYARDFVTGGNTAGAVTAYNFRRQSLRCYFGVAVGFVAVSIGAAVGEAAACAADDGEVAGAAVGEEPAEDWAAVGAGEVCGAACDFISARRKALSAVL
jgi:hypothetical protein